MQGEVERRLGGDAEAGAGEPVDAHRHHHQRRDVDAVVDVALHVGSALVGRPVDHQLVDRLFGGAGAGDIG